MADSEWVQLASSAGTVLGGATAFKEYGYMLNRASRLRRKLAKDLELLEKLPQDSPGREALQRAVDAEARELSAVISGGQGWDGAGLAVVAFFLVLGGALTVVAARAHGWWTWSAGCLAAVAFTVALAGFGTEWAASRKPKQRAEETGQSESSSS